MGFLAFFFAYILGGITLLPLVIVTLFAAALWTAVPVGDVASPTITRSEAAEKSSEEKHRQEDLQKIDSKTPPPKPRKGWLTVKRNFEDDDGPLFDGSYMNLMRSILDSRSKDPKRSRPKDMYFAVLKGSVLYLYEDEAMSECHAALELSSHEVRIWPDGLLDAELFTRRNAILLQATQDAQALPSVTKEMKLEPDEVEDAPQSNVTDDKEIKKVQEAEREEAFDFSTPWYIFVRSVTEMEDWYHAFVHASTHPSQTDILHPLEPIFTPDHMQYLVSHLDSQPDPIPMRWLNAFIGRLFFSVYRTENMEQYIIGRLMKKLSKVKRPGFLTDISVTEVSVGQTAPTFFKPMLKELTKEGDAAMEVGLMYKGEVRITVQATATINLGARFKTYEVKLVLAVVLRELEGNLLVKIKRPPSNRLWYAFTHMPRMELAVEPIVSDRQITWGMITKTIEGRLKEIVRYLLFSPNPPFNPLLQIMESVVMPNMDDIPFFETASYRHRGGIYADAVRKPASKAEEQLLPREGDTVKNGDQLPEADAVNATAEVKDHPPIPISISDDRLVASAPPTNTLSPPETSPAPRAATVHLPVQSPSPPKSHSKGKSWFPSAGSPNEDVTTSPPTPLRSDCLITETEPASPRGRTSGTGAEVSSKRGISAPPNGDSLEGGGPNQMENLPHRRESTLGRDRGIQSHGGSFSGDWSPSSTATTSATANINASTGSGTSSLFHAIKRVGTRDSNDTSPSRASGGTVASTNNDLSTAAKEAMRKWGVQWAGLKKEFQEARLEGKDIRTSGMAAWAAAQQQGLQESSSAGLPSSPLPSPSINSRLGMPKTFEEVRKAANERRVREERERVISDVVRSNPAAVPQSPTDKSRRRESAGPVLLNGTLSLQPSGSISSTFGFGGNTHSTGGVSPSTSPPPSAKFVQPTAKPTATVSTDPPEMKSILTGPVLETRVGGQVSTPSSMPSPSTSLPTPDTNMPAARRLSAGPPPTSTSTYIVAKQPSYGASMTIPGIHAKNKGEVMAIGFSPPSLETPERRGDGIDGPTSKLGASIKGVVEQLGVRGGIKLLRKDSAASLSGTGTISHGSTVVTPLPPGGFPTDPQPPAPLAPAAVISSEIPGDATRGTQADRQMPDDNQVNSAAISSQPGTVSSDTSPASAASDALKMVAERDAIAREKSIRRTGDHSRQGSEQAAGGEQKAPTVPEGEDLEPQGDP